MGKLERLDCVGTWSKAGFTKLNLGEAHKLLCYEQVG